MWTNLKRFQSKPSKQVPSQVSISKTSKFRHQPTIPFDLTCITKLGKKRIRCQAAAADTGIYRKTQKSKKRLHNSNKYHKTQSYSRSSSSSSFDEHNQIVRFNRWCVYDWSVFGGGLGKLGKVLAFLPSRFWNMHRWVGWIWSDWSEEKVSVLDSNFSTSKS